MTDCTITIAFPVYNVAAYVERSLCSALEQTFPLPYEVLVIDDKGSDGSMAIVNRLQQEHPQGSRIRIIEHPQNKGLGEASNTAIDNARGKYLLFLDSDDRLAPDALQVLYTKAEEAQAQVVIGSYEEVNEQGLYPSSQRAEHPPLEQTVPPLVPAREQHPLRAQDNGRFGV